MSTEPIDRDKLAGEKMPTRETALLWSVLFGAGTTLVKKLVTRYLMDEKMRLEWADLTTAVLSATISYVSFRNSYDDDFGLS